MARRKKKNTITYDSKETQTVVGLVSLIIGSFFLISIFTSTDTQNNIFSQVKSTFGDSTIFTSIFLLLFGLRFLGIKFPLTRTKSLIAQSVLIFVLAGLFTSFTANPNELPKLEKTNGGSVGSYIVIDFLGDTIPTQPATKFMLIMFAVILLPLVLSMSLKEIVEYLKKFGNWLNDLIKVLFFEGNDEEETEQKNIVQNSGSLPKAERLGDFNKILEQRKLEINKHKEDHTNDKYDSKDEEILVKPQLTRQENVDVASVKEGSVGESGLVHEELKYPNWKLPPASLLIPFKKSQPKEAAIDANASIIEQMLESFGIEAKVEEAFIGPSVVQYALNIPMGINVKKIANLSENIALALGVDSHAVRIESIPETTYLGIEVPRTQRDMVRFKEIFTSDEMQNGKRILPVTIGKDINGNSLVGAIEKMPHLLIAGATGSGKSVLTNSFITSLIMTKSPDELRLILVDPKQVELIDYNGIPHLLTPVITDMDKVINALKWLVNEMETRYTTLAHQQVRNIEQYNQKKGFAAMPYVVVVIDEMADMMMTANRVEAETAIVRLAQKARAVGIHLILATQRPSVNVITGLIKANIPGRVGMSVTSSTDSRVILDRIGAESLMGRGDMLYKAPDKTKAIRLQGSNIEQEEITRVVDFIKDQAPEVEYIPEILEKQLTEEEVNQEVLGDISGDSLIEQAIRIVVQSRKGSSSYLQRRLNIGFNRAARLLEELEEVGVVGPQIGSKPREVLISDADEFIASLK